MRRKFGLIAVAGVCALLAGGCAGKADRREAEPTAASGETEIPSERAGTTGVGPAPETVLLTGFEPFGGASLNPSWEAVRVLEGTRVGPVRIRVLRLSVVWGAPLPALRRACETWRPSAVFSFGQGSGGAIRFERVADNERRSIPDNRGALPPSPTIREDGLPSYTSSFPFEGIMKAYIGPPWPFRESREAGGYLCEECFYALETLREEVSWPMDVAFFHLPPLGSEVQVGRKRVSCEAEELVKCVRALVSAWITIRKGRILGRDE